MKSKKGDAGMTLILVIIIIVLFFGWLINIGQRECRTNRDCGSASYCGSDFACHEFPVIQQTVVQYNFLMPSIIIGIAIIIAVLIYRRNNQSQKEVIHVEEPLPAAKEPEEVEEISEPYYKSEKNIRTP